VVRGARPESDLHDDHQAEAVVGTLLAVVERLLVVWNGYWWWNRYWWWNGLLAVAVVERQIMAPLA